MRSILLLPLCLLTGLAHAAVLQPAEGVWRFSSSNGSGLTLDVRDNTIGIGIYTYDAEGKSTWYSGAGQLVDGTVDTSVAVYRETAPGVVEAVGAAKPVRLAFSSNTEGTMTFDGSAPLAVEQLAFGADYVTGWNPLGTNDQPLPDLRGRWLFASRPNDGSLPAAHEVEFAASSVSQDGTVATFTSIDYPVDGAPQARRNYEMKCGPEAGTSVTSCLLTSVVTPLAVGEAPVQLARINPRDLSPNRAFGTYTGGELFGFRVPSDVTAAPQPGIWQIRNRNGSGMTLDVRENGAAVGIFSYDAQGKAVWSLAQGPIVANTLAAPLVRFTGGSCLTCPQVDPTQEAAPRNLSLQFVSATRALLTVGEEAPIPLVLLPYGADYVTAPVRGDLLEADFGPHALPRLQGTWVFSQGDISTERAPDDAMVLDFVANSAVPSEEAPYADLIGARAATLMRPDLGTSAGELWSLDCAPTGETPNATCELGVLSGDDVTTLPGNPPAPRIVTAIAPVSELSGTRYVAVGAGESEFPVPVWGFRIPPRTP